MDLIDDWANGERTPPAPRDGVAAARGSARALLDAFDGFEPELLTLHCFEDVGYPWLHLVFDARIHPSVAIRAGRVIAEVFGAPRVYLNSLRPQGVYFLLDPAYAPGADLKASRYGATLAQIEEAWGAQSDGAAARSRVPTRPSRRQAR